MRILHTSDWHLGRSLEQVSRIEEQRELIDCLCAIVNEQGIDLVLVAGDIYDTYNPSAAAEELFYDAMDRLSGRGKRAVVVVAGNHDNPERLCAASPLAYKNGVILLGYPRSAAAICSTHDGSIAIVDAGPGWLELSIASCAHNAVIIALPFPSEARLEELLSRQAEEAALQRAYSDKIGTILATLSQKFRDDTVNLIVGHLFLRGGKESESERTLQVGGALTVDPDVLPAGAHFAALGHLHRPQQIKNEQCPACYAGSPLAYSFSEAGYGKAVYIIDAAPGKKAEINPLYLTCGKPLSRWVATDGVEQAMQWCAEGRDKNAWIDLEIVTARILTMEEQKELRRLHPGIINIRPRLKGEAAQAAAAPDREGKKIDELFRDFYRYRTGQEISAELMGAFIEVLNEEEGESTPPADGNGGEAAETEVS